MVKNKVITFGLYLLSPFLGFIFSFASKCYLNRTLLKFNIVLFSVWVGLTFSIASGSNSDILRYHELYTFHQNNSHSISWLWSNLFVEDGYADVFGILTTLIFTNLNLSFDIYLGFLGLIFGLFYSKYTSQLLDYFDKNDWSKLIVLFFALLIIPIWFGINNIRFTLVTMIFATSIFDWMRSKNTKSNILLICLTPLVHFSVFWVPFVVIFIFICHRFLKLKSLLMLFGIVAIVPMESVVMNTNLSSLIPEVYEDRSSHYVDLDNINEKMEKISIASNESSFHAKFLSWPYQGVFVVLPMLLGLISVRYRNKIPYNDILMMKWILFFGIIVGMVGFLPSFGRFKAFVILPAIILLFKYWYYVNRSYKPIMWVLLLLMSLYSIVKLRTALDYLSLSTLIGNPLSLLFTDFENRIALIDMIK